MSHRQRRRRLGQLVMAGLAGPAVSSDLRLVAREFDLGGVLLRAHNVDEAAQVAELTRDVQDVSESGHVWVSLEPTAVGGRPLAPGLPTWPAPATLGRADQRDLTERYARAVARELRALGVTLPLWPVLDVGARGAGATTQRTVSDDPAVVARHAVAIIETWHAEGLAAGGSSFPGLGEAIADAPDVLPLVDLPPDRLERVEWVPFQASIRAGVDALVVGHAWVPSLDDGRPASLSPLVVQERLRDQLAFDGVVWADDVAAPALARYADPGMAATRAIAAGCDGVLFGDGDPGRLHALIEALIRAIEDESLSAMRVDAALQRQDARKSRWLSAEAQRQAPRRPSVREVLGSAEHALIAEQLRQFA